MERQKELEVAQENPEWKQLRRSWCWGPERFREELLEDIGLKKGRQHHGEELMEFEEQKAERLIGEM